MVFTCTARMDFISQAIFVYIDDLSNMLIYNGVGCSNVFVDYMFYADDLCPMAPCAIAFQELLDICHSYRILVDDA